MDEGGETLSTMTLKEYLRILHKAILYADCAGERAYIPSLHYNRLVNLHEFVEEIAKLSAKIQPKTFEKGNPDQMEIVVDAENVNYRNFSKIFGSAEDIFARYTKGAMRKKNFRFLSMIEENFRNIMEMRNKLLLDPRAQDYLTQLAPSVDILEQILEQKENLHVIHGDPGFGKTIHLQQLAERFVQQQRETETPILPVYVKAKHLANAIENHASSLRGINKDEEEVGDVEDEKDTKWEFSTYANDKELHNVLTSSLANTHFPGDRQFTKAFLSLLGRYDGQLVLFVDAFDETAENDMPRLVHFLSRMTTEENNAVVLTNRNSHSLSFGKLWAKMPDRESLNDKISKYHIDFTPDELRYDMPEKLMAAWEIDGMVVEMRMEERYEAFNKVLTHPLFVGFFALMMKENQMMDELGDEEFGLSIKEYTPSHVVFLNNVVDLGIKKAISDRNVNVTPERMREIYEAIAYGYFVAQGRLSTIDAMLGNLQKVGILEVNNTEIEAIKNGVGPLYSSDGKQLQWTHKGMWEIGASRYAFQLPSLISDVGRLPELFLLSYLQQYSEETRAETLLDGLWSIIDNDSNHGESLVASLWKAFVPDIPLFSALNEITSMNIEVEIKSDLDEQETRSAEIIARRLRRGDTKYISPTYFDDCKHDFIRVAHLFGMSMVQFIRRYGELPRCGYWLVKNYLVGNWYIPPHHLFSSLPFLSHDNKHLFVNTMLNHGDFHMHKINPIVMCSAGTIDRAKEHQVDIVDFLLKKWHEMHRPIISRFNDTLNSVMTDIQIPERLETVLNNVDFDPAVLAHAILSDAGTSRSFDDFLQDVPIAVIELLGFSTKYHQGGKS